MPQIASSAWHLSFSHLATWNINEHLLDLCKRQKSIIFNPLETESPAHLPMCWKVRCNREPTLQCPPQTWPSLQSAEMRPALPAPRGERSHLAPSLFKNANRNKTRNSAFLRVPQTVRQTEMAQGREPTAEHARHRGSHPPPLQCNGKHPVRNTLCIWAFLELIICKPWWVYPAGSLWFLVGIYGCAWWQENCDGQSSSDRKHHGVRAPASSLLGLLPLVGKSTLAAKTSFFPLFSFFFFFLKLSFFSFFFLLKWRIQVFQIVQDMGQFPSDNRWANAVLFQPLSIGGGAGAQPMQVSGYSSEADPWQMRDSWLVFQQFSAYAVAVFGFDFPLLITKIGLTIIVIILMIQNNYCNYILFGKLLTQSSPKDPIGLKKGDNAQTLRKTKSLLKKREKQSADECISVRQHVTFSFPSRFRSGSVVVQEIARTWLAWAYQCGNTVSAQVPVSALGISWSCHFSAAAKHCHQSPGFKREKENQSVLTPFQCCVLTH